MDGYLWDACYQSQAIAKRYAVNGNLHLCQAVAENQLSLKVTDGPMPFQSPYGPHCGKRGHPVVPVWPVCE